MLTTLLSTRTVLLDGGLGSALIARGLSGGTCTALWNLEHPDDVREVHAGYLAAGSDVIHTNSFDANPPSLAHHQLDGRVHELNLAAARIAREAVQAAGRGLVAGDLGPSGLFRPPVGTATADDITAAFTPQITALLEGGVDSFALETFTDLEEARLAIGAIRALTDLPITACLTFDKKKRGYFTLMGDSLTAAAHLFTEEGVAALGANCSIGSEAMLEATSILVEATPLPVIVKPNAGLPALEDGQAVYRQEPADFARDLVAMVEAGARAVGGCCGTDDRFIATLAKALPDHST